MENFWLLISNQIISLITCIAEKYERHDIKKKDKKVKVEKEKKIEKKEKKGRTRKVEEWEQRK